ncbi:MAG: hypothetical protein ACQ9ET_00795 [Nitrosomonadaceae bacterium]
MKKQSALKPHELALHVAVLFRNPNLNDMEPVRFSMAQGIKIIQAAKPIPLDLTDPNEGIPFALQIERGNYCEKVKAAARLLILCLHAIERGETTEAERQNIPLHLTALAGYVPDQNASNAKRKRTKRSNSAFDLGIIDSLKTSPSKNWRERASWLDNEEIVFEWNDKELSYYDDYGNIKTISIERFRNKITEAKKKLKE